MLRQSFNVVLLDEIEKADPRIYDLLLEVLDEVRLTDHWGRVTHFRSSIIVMTSNLGAERTGAFGFGGRTAADTLSSAMGFFRAEYRAVAVMACDDEVVPLQARIEHIADGADLEDVYSTERHLLYVACTRAREHLLVTGVEPASEFLEDLQVEA